MRSIYMGMPRGQERTMEFEIFEETGKCWMNARCPEEEKTSSESPKAVAKMKDGSFKEKAKVEEDVPFQEDIKDDTSQVNPEVEQG